MYSHLCPIFLSLLVLQLLTRAFCQTSEKPKPLKCEGVLMVQGEVPGISGVNSRPFNQLAGNLSYSLGMDGSLILNSTVPSWHCTPIETRSNSSSHMRSLSNVFVSAQMRCETEVQDIDASWVTQWTKIKFSGQIYASIIAHDGICASPPTLLDSVSTCTYAAMTDGGLSTNSTCRWKTVDDVHHAGDEAAKGDSQ